MGKVEKVERIVKKEKMEKLEKIEKKEKIEKTVLGLTAKVTLQGPSGKEEQVVGRIDTGATKSSLDISLAGKLGLSPSTKTRLIKSASGVKRRPMVLLKIKLNTHIIEEEFTLADRSHMTFPVLIGQNILKKGAFLIDPLRNVS
ncbi:ATP-dependent zinc protease [Candidatus Woesearchaeota archaeon]|nr:ATP-dependent zinc protease [Candidatus Woesearchaeota archaeon]